MGSKRSSKRKILNTSKNRKKYKGGNIDNIDPNVRKYSIIAISIINLIIFLIKLSDNIFKYENKIPGLEGYSINPEDLFYLISKIILKLFNIDYTQIGKSDDDAAFMRSMDLTQIVSTIFSIITLIALISKQNNIENNKQKVNLAYFIGILLFTGMPIIVTAYRYINDITYDDININSYTVVSPEKAAIYEGL